ncbi:MAG: hypothetical protein RI883_1313 [Bacteroidota bacterium]|jgi:uncharacterized integral membrane protein
MTEYWNSLSFINKAKFVLSIILGILGVVFATLNWKEQDVHLLFVQTKMPLTLLIIFSMVVGYAFSFIFSYKKFRAKDLEIDELKKEIEELKSDN